MNEDKIHTSVEETWNLSIVETSDILNIPKSTMHDHLKKNFICIQKKWMISEIFGDWKWKMNSVL